ncbi:pyridoxal 5'-phosphate synthase glutaminase subunit PdxT [Peribacillus asahii]|uniref:pyridoxal 5'-phosphate synthase glutaminase subunit PdxT n=1 Tax=Peribacillus asahii TaxID=228899 RepID=UPI00381CC92B
MTTIGVLDLQGATIEHIQQLEGLGVDALLVKKPEQLQQIDGLIIPGGESTAIGKMMKRYDFIEPIQQFASLGKPIFGTCAGLVLLAKDLGGAEDSHLNLMDISIQRNGFGRQRDSFEIDLSIKGIDHPVPAVFIRAPYIESVGNNVDVLATHDDKIVAAKQNNLLVSSFHPELTDDCRFLQLFINMVESKLQSQ